MAHDCSPLKLLFCNVDASSVLVLLIHRKKSVNLTVLATACGAP
jgi:hypothetical protein